MTTSGTTKTFDQVMTWHKNRHKDNQHAVVPIVGDAGGGKTQWAQLLAMGLDDHYRPRRNLFRNPDEAIRAIRRLPRGSVIIWDEFARGGRSDAAMTALGKEIATIFDTCRKYNHHHFLLMPNREAFPQKILPHVHYVWAIRRQGKRRDALYLRPYKYRGQWKIPSNKYALFGVEGIPNFEELHPDLAKEYDEMAFEAFNPGRMKVNQFREQMRPAILQVLRA